MPVQRWDVSDIDSIEDFVHEWKDEAAVEETPTGQCARVTLISRGAEQTQIIAFTGGMTFTTRSYEGLLLIGLVGRLYQLEQYQITLVCNVDDRRSTLIQRMIYLPPDHTTTFTANPFWMGWLSRSAAVMSLPAQR